MIAKYRSVVLLTLAAMIWGAAFTAAKAGMDFVGPCTFNAVRHGIGALVLLPVVIRLNGKQTEEERKKEKSQNKTLLSGGVCCGCVLACASLIQQLGLNETSPGKAGFITALYIIIVPICGLFFKKKVPLSVWIGVALALVGMYLLCIKDTIAFSKGDIYLFLCAFAFSGHIMVIDFFAPKVNAVKLSCLQFFVCSFVCWIFTFIFETPNIKDILNAYVPILYSGVLSSGVGYTLQIAAQKDLHPAVASILMSLESVFSAVFGWLCTILGMISGGTMSLKETIGCVVMFAAIIVAQIDGIRKR